MIELPETATATQIEIYNKNVLLRKKAYKNCNKYGILISLIADLGSQDYIDTERFINHYPYSMLWHKLAYEE